MVNNILLVIPYIGHLDESKYYAIKQLSLIQNATVYLIRDHSGFEEDLRRKMIPDCIEHCRIEDIFCHDNTLGISLSPILKNPYKLCDYKPFFNLIFNVNADSYDYWGWSDLDCVFNVSKLNAKFSSLASKDKVYGDRGHLMLFGSNATQIVQSEFLKSSFLLKEQGVDLFVGHRHFALDEFLFLHVILKRLSTEKEVWVPGYFKPYWDVDYKNLIPKNYVANISFDLNAIYRCGEVSDFVYMHLQKRKLEQGLSFTDVNYMGVDSVNGHVYFLPTVFKLKYPDFLTALHYRLRVFFRRARERIYNHRFSPRPRFK